jgi:signal transduction histidine kinase/CheY-like chemotaxis protein
MEEQPIRAENLNKIKNTLMRVNKTQSDFNRIICLSNTAWDGEGGFYITTNDGETPPAGYDNTTREWFVAAKKAHGYVVFSAPFLSEITGHIVANIAIDILDDSGRSLGVMSGILPSDTMRNIIKQRNQFESQSTFIITGDGRFVASGEREMAAGTDFFEDAGLEKYRDVILNSSAFSILTGGSFVCSTYIPAANWFLVSITPEAMLFTGIRNLLLKMMVSALLVFAASCFLISVLTRKFIVEPIRSAEFIAEALAGEDFSVKIPEHRTDEIGSMFRAFVKIRDNLKGTIQTLNSDLVAAKEHAEAERDKAETASRAKSSFLASMSHEIRTPMNAIIGMSELIRTDNFDKTQKNYFSDIRKMTSALLQIINDILDFSKIEAGKMELVPTHFNLRDLYNNICSITAFTASGKSIVFTHTIAEDLPDIIYGDELRMRQVITNIVNNAIKYTREGYVSFDIGRITEDGEEFIVVKVSDTGIGIKKEDIPKIFMAFEQADIQKNRGIIGTGLGLAITNRFVKMMHGEVSVESEYGKGSVFMVKLPLTRGNPELVRKEVSAHFFVTPDVKMLVVDDVPFNLTVATGFLSTHRIATDTASDALSALEKIKSTNYDIVFMDHMMPEIDGIDATKMIRALYVPEDPSTERFRDLPVVALTANAIAGVREFFLQAGMNDFVSKPIESSKLNTVILSFLPPEKIIYSEDDELALKSKEQNDKNKALLAKLDDIEGLNNKKGLALLQNNIRIYIEMLSEFADEYEDYVLELGELCETDIQRYSVKIHAVKGICASLGCETLRDWAYKLELASKDGDVELCKNENTVFCEELVRLGEALRLLGLTLREPEAAKTAVSRETLVKKLKALVDLCQGAMRGEIGAGGGAEKASTELSRMAYNNEVESDIRGICTHINMYDYDEAEKELEILLKKL